VRRRCGARLASPGRQPQRSRHTGWWETGWTTNSFGGLGNDLISGRGGDDRLNGSGGWDLIKGGGGRDKLGRGLMVTG
jgi:hypothetical protein